MVGVEDESRSVSEQTEWGRDHDPSGPRKRLSLRRQGVEGRDGDDEETRRENVTGSEGRGEEGRRERRRDPDLWERDV